MLIDLGYRYRATTFVFLILNFCSKSVSYNTQYVIYGGPPLPSSEIRSMFSFRVRPVSALKDLVPKAEP